MTQPEEIAEGLLYSVGADGIAEVKIDRPEKRNAMSVAVFNGLTEAWRRINADDNVRVAILTSTDCGTFCAGMDLKEATELRKRDGRDITSYIDDPFQREMLKVRVPLIAAMTGNFTAGGMMLSLNCDLRVGLAGTSGGIAEVKVGRGSPWGVPLLWMLPQAVLMEMKLIGKPIAIERLQALGFVNVVEDTPDAVRATARAIATEIASNAPLSVRAAKAAVLAAAAEGSEAGFKKAMEIYSEVYASQDAIEGMASFAEKRKPVWKGK